MKKPLARKIIEAHLVKGKWSSGSEIAIKIDQTLTQDATGTVAYQEFETLGLGTVKTELSASYVDHNLLQTDFRNADDHAFLMQCAMKYGVYFSPPGNGVSHPVHMERFGCPGKTLLGADSHTSTAGALGMIAIGAGGLDVALAMAGEPFYLVCPKILGVRLTNKLCPWVSAKDVILEMLRRKTVRGGLGRIVEYYGPGVKTLSVTERATIANMGAELGATTSIFASDSRTKEYLKSQGRQRCFTELCADDDAEYDEREEIDLSKLEPMIACPSSPDNVKKVSEVEGIKISQAIIGSSVNFSYRDMMAVALSLKRRTIAPGVSLEINPGSRAAFENVELAGGARLLTHAGARIHQSGCLGCVGMGQAPATGTVSVRTFPRNFPGRSGTVRDQVYLSSPETAVAAAIFGEITDPRKLGKYPRITEPRKFVYNDSIIIKPLPIAERKKIAVTRGPNIAPFPIFDELTDDLEATVLIKTRDNISTDDILPAGNSILPLRSNIPLISEHVFERLDAGFAKRAKEVACGAVIGGENYGQGSSREHAAIAPRYLGVRVKIAKSFARIHRSNLINFGIIPLNFTNPGDYDVIELNDVLIFKGIKKALEEGQLDIRAEIKGKGRFILLKADMTERELGYVMHGGRLNAIRNSRR